MIIRWLNRAVETFIQMYDYYYEINPAYAKQFYVSIIAGINLISKFPGFAPKEQLLEKCTKEFRALLILKKYKVIYYIQHKTIYIFDIWDCRQNPEVLTKNIR